jgi:DNA-binding winged helix-turn-helix (wHTH) protein/Tol biopolymer transport system component
MIARFDDFELDTQQCRLSRNGEPIRLEKLPLDLLIVFVQRPQELLGREEIAAAVWGSETFVDAEHGINTAIRKIRNALQDDPADPRYIETVVRRGYRFKSPVIVIEPEPAPPAPVIVPPSAPVTISRNRSLVWIAGVALAALAIGAAVAAMWRGSATPAPMLRWRPLTREVHTYTRLASDGHKVYWTEFDDSGCHPYSVPIEGGEASMVRIPFRNAAVLDASSDGSLLINPRENCKDTVIQGPIWEIALNSGAARRVGDLFGQDATYSPDGRRIAMIKGNQLWIANRDGSDATKIGSLPSMAWTMHWSPDAQWLRFALFESDKTRFRLWEASSDGKVVRPLLSDWKDSSEKLSGVWLTADDFLFSATRRGSVDLWMLRPAPHLGAWSFGKPAIEQVTAGPLDFEGPTTVPGANEVAVIGTHRQGELQQFDFHSRSFVPYLRGVSAHMVDFSRDGAWMTYVSYPEDDLWRSRADGSEALQLTHLPMRAGVPRMSPDGRQIAFTAEVPGEPLRVMLIGIDGGTPRAALHQPSGESEVSPTWSPDGTRLLIRGDRHTPGSESYFQNNVLQIVDLSTQQVTTIPGSSAKFNQRWSPDGTWIVATPNNEAELDLYDVAAGRWSVLATMRADYPSWSADSKSVFFVGIGEHAAIYRVPLDTRHPEFVASLDHIDRSMDELWSQWAGLTPAGAPLILKSADLQSIYALSFKLK